MEPFNSEVPFGSRPAAPETKFVFAAPVPIIVKGKLVAKALSQEVGLSGYHGPRKRLCLPLSSGNGGL